MDGESTANAIEKTSKIKQFSPLLSEKFQLYTQIAVLVMTTASAVQQKILSSCVVGVDAHVLIRQVAAPGTALTDASPQPQPDLHGGLTQRGTCTVPIKRQGLTALHQLMRPDPERNLLQIERDTGTTSGSDDPTPVGITAVDCCFHQR